MAPTMHRSHQHPVGRMHIRVGRILIRVGRILIRVGSTYLRMLVVFEYSSIGRIGLLHKLINEFGIKIININSKYIVYLYSNSIVLSLLFYILYIACV